MDDIAENAKCFAPQHLDDDAPDRSWGLERLSELVQRQNGAIEQRERLLAPLYWGLGQTLVVIRQEFTHGEWCEYLASMGITRTRWSRARKIFQTHDSPEAVQNMSIDEACGRPKDPPKAPKRRKSVKKKRQHSKETTEVDAKSAILQDVGGQCAALEDEAKDMDMFSKRALLPVARLALEALTRLVQELSN